MSAFTIDIKNIEDAFKRIATLENNLTEGVDQAIDDSAEAIAKEARNNTRTNGTFDEGALAGRINVNRQKKYEREVGANVFYAPYIEFGTKTKVSVPPELSAYASQFQGKGKGSFKDLVAAIAAWVKRKGIKTGTYSVKTRRRQGNKAQKEKEDNGLIWAIAVSIARKGIRASPFMFPALNEEKPKLLKRLAEMLLK
jgi:hypothetical protein